MDILFTIIGSVGSFLVLVAFWLNQSDKLKNTNIWYDTLNFMGSALLLAYALYGNSIPFVVVNFVWAAMSAKDIYTFLKKRKK